LLQSTDLVCTLPARFLGRYFDTLTPLPFDARRFSPFDNHPLTLGCAGSWWPAPSEHSVGVTAGGVEIFTLS
jgi:hypothetical protein